MIGSDMKSAEEVTAAQLRAENELRQIKGLPPLSAANVRDVGSLREQLLAPSIPAQEATMTSPFPSGKGLAAKLAHVAGEVGSIPRNGYNDFHHYHYIQETDLVDRIRPLLSEAGISLLISVEEVTREPNGKDKNGNVVNLTTAKLTFEFVDSESRERQKVSFAGCGEDASDKGLYKAYTGAVKYFLMKTFLVSTGDDPEREDAVKSERKKPGPKPKDPIAGSKMSAEQFAELSTINEGLGTKALAPQAFKALTRDMTYDKAKVILEAKNG